MDESLEQLCEVSWMFSRQPEKDFTRNRKLSFPKLVSFVLAMEGGTLTTELIERFGCSPDTASASAFVQQRSKLAPETFPSLFDLFVRKTQPLKLYKGFRLFAADGSDIQIPNNPGHISSHYPGTNGQAPYNILHLDAIYDLLQCTYQDASLVGDRDANEQASLCCMVDRSPVENALIMMDRGYEGYNLLAHIQEKGWKFLLRVKAIPHNSRLTPYAPLRRLRHTICAPKMLDNTQSIICAFWATSGAPRSPYRYVELCGVALRIFGKLAELPPVWSYPIPTNLICLWIYL